MKKRRESLNYQQYKAVAMLAAGCGRDEIAKELKVSLPTVNKWAEREDFKVTLRDALSRIFDAAISELMLSTQDAIKELNKLALDPDTPARTRVSAINTILTFTFKAKELQLEERIEALEKMVNNNEYIEIEATEIRGEITTESSQEKYD
jgi:transcriptional regulator with XRE-family HTH domain